MSNESQLPNSEDQELTPEQLAGISGGAEEKHKLPIDVNEVSGDPPPGNQTPGQDSPDQLTISIPL